MSAPFAPEQDVATALVAAGAIFGIAGSLFGFTAGNTTGTTNLFTGTPQTPFAAGLSGVNPGAWIDPSQPAPKNITYMGQPTGGALYHALIRFHVVTTVEQGLDAKDLGWKVARQIRDFFDHKVYRNTALVPAMAAYNWGLCNDQGDVKLVKRNEARQFLFYTDLLLQWANVT